MSIAQLSNETRTAKQFFGSDGIDADVCAGERVAVSAVVGLAARLQVPAERVATCIGLAPRSFTRRQVHGARLSPPETHRLRELEQTLAHATEVLGSLSSARQWLLGHIPALNGAVPFEIMASADRVAEVNEVLGRIEHGIYS